MACAAICCCVNLFNRKIVLLWCVAVFFLACFFCLSTLYIYLTWRILCCTSQVFFPLILLTFLYLLHPPPNYYIVSICFSFSILNILSFVLFCFVLHFTLVKSTSIHCFNEWSTITFISVLLLRLAPHYFANFWVFIYFYLKANLWAFFWNLVFKVELLNSQLDLKKVDFFQHRTMVYAPSYYVHIMMRSHFFN